MIKRLLILSLAATATGASIYFTVRSHGQGTPLTVSPPVAQQTGSLPEYVPYMFLFDHHGSNLRKAAELEREGKDATFFHSMFKDQIGLTDEKSAVFDQVTRDCEQELAVQDAKAQVVISKFKARYPSGIVPADETIAPPPPELTTLQLERNAIILRARDRLHAALGEGEFARFDSYIRVRFASRVQTN
jgi:hypothetical protein